MFTEKEIVNYEISKVFDTAKYLKLVIEFLNVAALVFWSALSSMSILTMVDFMVLSELSSFYSEEYKQHNRHW